MLANARLKRHGWKFSHFTTLGNASYSVYTLPGKRARKVFLYAPTNRVFCVRSDNNPY